MGQAADWLRRRRRRRIEKYAQRSNRHCLICLNTHIDEEPVYILSIGPTVAILS